MTENGNYLVPIPIYLFYLGNYLLENCSLKGYNFLSRKIIIKKKRKVVKIQQLILIYHFFPPESSDLSLVDNDPFTPSVPV